MDTADRQHVERLIEKHQRRLHLLEERAAILGISTPPELSIEIQDIQSTISQLKLQISNQSGNQIDSVDAFDVKLIRQHRRVFERPAFRVPCMLELSIPELLEAVDEVQAALNTGKMYSRDEKLLGDFQTYTDYKSGNFIQAFGFILDHLTQLKRLVTNFDSLFHEIHPRYQSNHPSYHRQRSFDFMLVSLSNTIDGSSVRELFRLMDEIDETRNIILVTLNSLLKETGEPLFRLIQLSSETAIATYPGSPFAKHLR